MKPTLLVLAAGMGSRYGGLKQLDAMGPNGETVLDYGVFDAVRAGFGRVVFIIRKDFADEFKEKIGAKFSDKIQVDYAFQDLSDLPDGFSVPDGRVKPWGTSHAILAARELIREPFAVINADDFYGRDAYLQMANSLQHSGDAEVDRYAIVAYKLSNTLSDHGAVNRGICSTIDGKLSKVEEYTEIAKDGNGVCRGTNLEGAQVEVALDTLVSMNLWGFSPNLMHHLQSHFVAFLKERGHEMTSECYIPTVVDDLINAGKAECHLVSSDSQWFGVTYPEDKPHVVANIQALIDAGEYPAQLWS